MRNVMISAAVMLIAASTADAAPVISKDLVLKYSDSVVVFDFDQELVQISDENGIEYATLEVTDGFYIFYDLWKGIDTKVYFPRFKYTIDRYSGTRKFT